MPLGHTPLCPRAAWIDKCRPNLLITESTYATTIRDSKRCRERDFLKKVHETVERGGKVRRPGARAGWWVKGASAGSRWAQAWPKSHLSPPARPAGSDTRVCTRPCPGALHPAGDILVRVLGQGGVGVCRGSLRQPACSCSADWVPGVETLSQLPQAWLL